MPETVPSTANDKVPNGDTLPSQSSDSLRSLCTTLHNQITAFLQEDVQTETLRAAQAQTKHSLKIIQEALDRYPLHTLSLSYNGGKDCLVLLILYLSLLSTHPSLPASLPAIYIPPFHPFDSVTAFTVRSSKHYHLSLDIHKEEEKKNIQGGGGGGMKAAFASYLSKNRAIEAIFVGTRRTDPHGGKLSPSGFDVTDGGWPRFMRVHPVIEWRYAEVWAGPGMRAEIAITQFLRHLEIPYCELYDQGYTSLGGTNDTHPNPALRVVGEEGEEVRFRPAYELEEDGEERLGRDW
ncbi:MAG: hypothetical protein Q9222_000071 [Ikaeria aurantiellina]